MVVLLESNKEKRNTAGHIVNLYSGLFILKQNYFFLYSFLKLILPALELFNWFKAELGVLVRRLAV